MQDVIKISQYSSLNFSKWKHYFEKDEKYIQVFTFDDIIRTQLSINQDYDISVVLIDLNTNQKKDVDLVFLESDADYDTFYFQYQRMDYGLYKIEIAERGYNDILAECCFEIIDSHRERDTVKLRYTNLENLSGTAFINNNGGNNIFDFRVEGGFLFQNIQFNVESNNFRNQLYNNIQLSAYPYEVKKLTIGTCRGVPVWVARKINLIFSLSEVMINGDTYVRSEGSQPEVIQLDALYPLYVINIDVEPDNFDIEKGSITSLLLTEKREYLMTEDRYRLKIE
ncbi:MAG: hypothetical protein LBL79_01240 [Prevotella sp.]|nr:hypothetical protein [Prevotella sp.]